MSEKMTVIRLPGLDSAGWMDYGEVDAAQMIVQYRLNAMHDLKKAKAILDADETDFSVNVVRGIHVQHHIKTLQEGRGNPAIRSGKEQAA